MKKILENDYQKLSFEKNKYILRDSITSEWVREKEIYLPMFDQSKEDIEIFTQEAMKRLFV